VDISTSKDGKYLIINNNTKEDSEIWILDRADLENNYLPTKIIERKEGTRSFVDHLNDLFVVITNESVESKNFKL
jgi:oligopeptidase B